VKKFMFLGIGALIVAGIAMTLFLSEDSAGPARRAGSNLQPLEFHIDWWESPEYIGYFMADMLGFYADRGLDVTIKPGGGSAAAARALLEGRIALGTANAHSVAREVWEQAGAGGSGWEDGPRIVAVVFTRSPSVLVTQSNLKISTPENLAGLRIGFPSASAEAYREFVELLEKHPEVKARVTLEPFFLQAIPQLKSGAIDGLLSYLMEVPADLESENYRFNAVPLSQLGADVGGQCIAVGRGARIDPAVLEGFLSASARGWEYVRNNPDNAAKLFVGKYPDATLDRTRIVIRQCMDLLPPPSTTDGRSGYTDPSVLRETAGRSFDMLQGPGGPAVDRETFVNTLARP
jgi:ABC-type nitrate/sulfonate/bicarbonate transport system substrate-binding protein